MTELENKMVETLIDLKQNHGVFGVKAEFEAEGTRLEEALRLKEVVTKASLNLTIKVGGCEAIKDMYDARAIGVTRIVGPMIETPYALRKFISAAKVSFPEEERHTVEFLINIETIDGYKNFNRMLITPEIKSLSGIVLGRVDLTGSLELNRDVNNTLILDIAKDLSEKCDKNNLKLVVGGGVDKDSLLFLRALPYLDSFETRKIIFNARSALSNDPEIGILKAVGFELMWLKNKRNFYGLIYNEDKIRLEMLEKRYSFLIKEAGGNS